MMILKHAVLGATLLTQAVIGQSPPPEYWVDPVRGKSSHPGTAEAPWKSLEALAATGKLSKLPAGATIRLRAGHHGSPRIVATQLTIAAADGERATFGRLTIAGEDLQLRGLTVSPAYASRPYSGFAVTIGERTAARRIRFELCAVFSRRNSDDWGAQDWIGANSGIRAGRRAEYIEIRDCHVANTRFAIEVNAPHSTVIGNVIADYSADGIRITRDAIHVEYNVIRNPRVGIAAGDKNHDDAIQCFLFNKGSGPVHDCRIVGNLIIARTDDDLPLPSNAQGIGLFDGPLHRFVVRENVCLVSHWHGVAVYDAQNCTIFDNACFSRWPGKMRPWVKLGRKKHTPHDNVVRDNMAHSIELGQSEGLRASGNTRVTERAFWARYRALANQIEQQFGATHEPSGVPRIGWRPESN